MFINHRVKFNKQIFFRLKISLNSNPKDIGSKHQNIFLVVNSVHILMQEKMKITNKFLLVNISNKIKGLKKLQLK